MKFKKFVRFGSLALCCAVGMTVLGACGEKEPDRQEEVLPAAPEGAIVDAAGTPALLSGDFRLDFAQEDGGYAVRLVDTSLLATEISPATSDAVRFEAAAPAGVTVMVNARLGSHQTQDAAASYSEVTAEEYGYRCTSDVLTQNGSKICFEDRYYLQGGTFALSRRAEVETAGEGDEGFETVYSFSSAASGANVGDFDYFIPSILYKDSKDMTSGAQGSNLSIPKLYVKETRTGLPLAMLREKSSGVSLALAHLEPEISAGGKEGGGANGEADNGYQYGSVGYSSRGTAVDFCYPCAEMIGGGWTRIYHEMEAGSSHTYKLSLLPEKQQTYAVSMTETFKAAFEAESPEVSEDVDIGSIYNDNIEVFDASWKEFAASTASPVAGVPFSILLDVTDDYGDFTATGYSLQMGFIGQQTSIGYFLLREGKESGNAALQEKGKKMLDFWSSNRVSGTTLPAVWWDPNESGATARTYPSFLRCFVDGMEGMLDACIYAQQAGIDGFRQWESAVLKVGDWMAANQNDDGSFYRAYETNGSVCTRSDEPTWQGESKLNTPVAVRFLVRLYEYTGEEKFREAAVKAAEFSYDNLYLDREKYVGGTPDNPNTVDKEAAIYALYCFDAAYELTGEEKYLEAAEHAAVSALSWVYCYDFAVPSDADYNTFRDGGVSGFSLIATGHSGADNYSAVLYYEFFKLYLHTGDEFYKNVAYFLQQNTKLSSDYDGEVGYAFRALCPEATGVADFALGGSGANQWLVWCGVVNIQPIVYMRSTFGEADIASLADSDLAALQAQLKTYGSGGKVE